jgi:hypothetical protein
MYRSTENRNFARGKKKGRVLGTAASFSLSSLKYGNTDGIVSAMIFILFREISL